MFSSLQIEGYRCFERFEMTGLGRINLLVGTNNSGKTSVLEAIYLLASGCDPAALWQILDERGERIPPLLSTNEDRFRQGAVELGIAHLFRGRDLQVGSKMRISGRNGMPQRTVECVVGERASLILNLFEEENKPISEMLLRVTGNPKPPVELVPLTGMGGITNNTLTLSALRRNRFTAMNQPVFFISTKSLAGDELVAIWNKIALTPNEPLVLKALNFVEPDVERIAAQASGPFYPSPARGGFIVKLKGSDQPVPIGSLGDGMWRMLAMAIAITQCKGGVLLVDEIDTGLHYTVMSQMWSLIYNAAKELDVQVFATTHSYDCVYSLAAICSSADMRNSVTVQRIEPDKQRSIPYDEEEITMAASRDIEVR